MSLLRAFSSLHVGAEDVDERINNNKQTSRVPPSCMSLLQPVAARRSHGGHFRHPSWWPREFTTIHGSPPPHCQRALMSPPRQPSWRFLILLFLFSFPRLSSAVGYADDILAYRSPPPLFRPFFLAFTLSLLFLFSVSHLLVPGRRVCARPVCVCGRSAQTPPRA